MASVWLLPLCRGLRIFGAQRVLCGGTSLILCLVTIAQAEAACSKRLSRVCLDKLLQASRNAVTACKWPNSATLLLLLLLLAAGLRNVSARGP